MTQFGTKMRFWIQPRKIIELKNLYKGRKIDSPTINHTKIKIEIKQWFSIVYFHVSALEKLTQIY